MLIQYICFPLKSTFNIGHTLTRFSACIKVKSMMDVFFVRIKLYDLNIYYVIFFYCSCTKCLECLVSNTRTLIIYPQATFFAQSHMFLRGGCIFYIRKHLNAIGE